MSKWTFICSQIWLLVQFLVWKWLHLHSFQKLARFHLLYLLHVSLAMASLLNHLQLNVNVYIWSGICVVVNNVLILFLQPVQITTSHVMTAVAYHWTCYAIIIKIVLMAAMKLIAVSKAFVSFITRLSMHVISYFIKCIWSLFLHLIMNLISFHQHSYWVFIYCLQIHMGS